MSKLTLLFLCSIAVPAFGGDLRAGHRAYMNADYATALKEWKPLAEQGDDQAQYFLGLLYEEGKGVPQDDKESAKWYRLAAEQGHERAQFQ